MNPETFLVELKKARNAELERLRLLNSRLQRELSDSKDAEYRAVLDHITNG